MPRINLEMRANRNFMECEQPMEALVLQHQQQIAQEIRELIQLMDSTYWRNQVESLKIRLEQISNQMKETLQRLELPDTQGAQQKIHEALQHLNQHVEELRQQLEQRTSDFKKSWKGMRKHIAHAYDRFASGLAIQNIYIPRMRPTNYARSLFHVCSGLSALFMIQHSFAMPVLAGIMGVLLCVATGLEISRRYSPSFNDFLMRHLGVIAHPHEHHRVNSGTWYIGALFLLALTVSPMAASLAVLLLGCCDPAAAFVGRRWGRIRLVVGRTLEGTATFVFTGIVVSVAVLWLYYRTQYSWSQMFLIAAVASCAGAVAELFSKRLDDNLTIPLAVGWCTTALLFLL